VCIRAASSRDVSKVIRHFQDMVRLECEEREEANAKSKRPKFTERERGALKVGLGRFGYGKWEAIPKECSVFHGRHRADVYVSWESVLAVCDVCRVRCVADDRCLTSFTNSFFTSG
jgi:hypothetical protein